MSFHYCEFISISMERYIDYYENDLSKIFLDLTQLFKKKKKN